VWFASVPFLLFSCEFVILSKIGVRAAVAILHIVD
jgi:hypothetical protein